MRYETSAKSLSLQSGLSDLYNGQGANVFISCTPGEWARLEQDYTVMDQRPKLKIEI